MNRIVGNSQLIQKVNRLKVLNYIRRNPDIPRPAIAQQTGLSVSSLTNITSYLFEKGLLTESGTENVGRVGRKGTLLRFRAEAYNLICIFLSAESINISYTDLEGSVISRICIDSESLKPQEFINTVRQKVITLINEHNKNQVLGIQVAISGMVLNGNRFVLSSSLKWTEFDLKETLEKETGIPVFVENISVLKAMWYFGCSNCADKDNMLLVDLENGIGACQYYNSEINRAMLGEIGHTTVEKDGELCFCGNRGCLETMCSVQRVEQLYSEYSDTDNVPITEITAKLSLGDVAAKRAVSECAQYLGIGLANLVNICKPSLMVINIGDIKSLNSITELAVEELYRRAYPALLEDLDICEASINEEETLRGAAFNLCDLLFDISYSGNIIE